MSPSLSCVLRYMINADVINNLPSPKVMVIGDFLLDRYIEGKIERISPEAPIQIFKVQKDSDIRLGGAANVVHNLMTLGARVIALGASGPDDASKKTLQLLSALKKKWGVERLDYKGLVFDRNHHIPVKERMIAHDQQVLRVDKESQDEGYQISSNIENKIIRYCVANIKKADIVILSDYNKGVLTKGLLKKVISLCRRYKKRVLIGPKGRDFTKYRGATAVVPNRSETEEATGIPIIDKTSYKKAAHQMLKNYGLDLVVITLGSKGLYLMDKKGVSASDAARHRDVYDVTGAGDTVLATLGIAFASKLPYQDALHLANLAAGVVVSKVGTATVTREDIIQHHYLKSQHENIKAEHKFKNVKELTGVLSGKKTDGKKVVFTNGCFDLIHSGHIRTLEFARAQGDILVVGLNSDKSVRIIKGRSRPILNQSDRIKVLSAFSAVDYIVLFDQPTPLELIKKLKPDVLVKGADWDEGRIVGADVVRSYGGRIARVPLIPGISTSDIIRKINKSK